MVLTTLNGYNYHTDAASGRLHQLRASFSYALDLLDLGDKQYEQRAFDILEKCISLQDTVSGSKPKEFGDTIWKSRWQQKISAGFQLGRF